jgi:RimJ/RimL family protein N-acetyltransferase
MAGRRRMAAKGLLLKVLAKLVYRRVVLFERELRDLWMEHSSDVPLRVRRLQRKDVPAYVAFREKQSAEEVHRRLDEGSFCYVTWTGDRISSAVWYRSGPAWVPEINRHLAVAPSDIYAYDSWTAREMRGRNIAAVRGERTMKLLRGAGYERQIGYALAENPSALRVHEKLGMRRVGTLGYVQLGPLRLDFTRIGDARTEWRLRRSPRPLLRRPVLRPS